MTSRTAPDASKQHSTRTQLHLTSLTHSLTCLSMTGTARSSPRTETMDNTSLQKCNEWLRSGCQPGKAEAKLTSHPSAAEECPVMRWRPALLLQCCATACSLLFVAIPAARKPSACSCPTVGGPSVRCRDLASNAHFSDCLRSTSKLGSHDDWHHQAVLNGSVGHLQVDSFASLVGLNQNARPADVASSVFLACAGDDAHVHASGAVALSTRDAYVSHSYRPASTATCLWFALCTLSSFACELLPRMAPRRPGSRVWDKSTCATSAINRCLTHPSGITPRGASVGTAVEPFARSR